MQKSKIRTLFCFRKTTPLYTFIKSILKIPSQYIKTTSKLLKKIVFCDILFTEIRNNQPFYGITGNTMNIIKKIENFWYYYKGVVIVGGIFLAFFVISAVQFSSKLDSDATVLYVGKNALSRAELDSFSASVSQIMKDDYNGDGEKKISYIEITVVPDEANKTLHLESLERYRNEVFGGDGLIYLLDHDYYYELLEQNLIVPLSEILDTAPENAFDENAFLLSSLDAYALPGFSNLPSDTFVCLRYPIMIGIGAEESQDRFDIAKQIFKDIVTYDLPEASD